MMNRTLYSYLFIWLCVSILATPSLAQTITTGTLSSSAVCPGGTVTVTFATSSTFASTNSFSAQLSDASGNFTVSPPIIGSVTSTTARAVTATIPPNTAVGTGYRIRVVSSNPVSISSTSSQAFAIGTPPPGTSPVSYCLGQSATVLTATGTNLKWYDAASSLLAVTPTPSTTAVGSTTYLVSQTLNGCESARTSLVVTVTSAPAPPGVADLNLCVNSPASSLTANGTGLTWFDNSGKILNEAPTPNTGTASTQVFKVTQTPTLGCVSPAATITVTVKPTSPAPAVSTPGPYCQGAITQPLSATGTGLKWYDTNQIGGVSSDNPPSPNADTPGTKTYYVTQNTNGCESSPRTGIAVTVKSKPNQPGTSPLGYCIGQPPSSLTATGTDLKWYTAAGTLLAVAPTPSTTAVGSTTYYVSQTIDGCESERAGLVVTINGLPAAPGVANLSLCISTQASSLTASGTGLKWYDASDKPLSEAPTPNTSAVGTQVFKVTQTSVQGCISPAASITVTVNPLSANPTVTAPAPYCQGITAAPLSATGVSLRWYGPNASGGTGSTTVTTPNTTAPGTTIYYVNQNTNGCESNRAGITVVVKPTPNPPGVSAVEFCQGSTPPVLTATLITSATVNWYGTSPTSGTATTTAPTPSNAISGNTTYYVSQTLDGCEGNRAALSVRVKPLPAVPNVAPVSFCNNDPASTLIASGSNLKWYDANDNPISGGAPTPGTGTVGNQTYKVSQTVEGCEGPKANLVVTIKPLPGAPNVANLNYCLPTQDQPAQTATALTANGQNLRWFNPDGNSFSTAPTPNINQLGTQTYQVSQTVDGCTSTRATLQVVVRTTAAPTVAKSLVTYCINDKAVPLAATGETGSTLKWINPYNQLSDEAPTPYTLNTSVKSDGDPFYVYQIGQSGCYSERTTIKVLVNAQPTLALVAPVTSVNLGQRANLQLKFTSAAPYSYTITGGYSGTAYRADTTISVLPRGNTTYQVITVSNSCGVGLPGNPATATVTVRVPTVTTSAFTSSTLCAGTSLTVPFTTTGDFNQGNTFGVELVSVADTSKKYTTSVTAAGSPVTAPIPLIMASGQYYVRVRANNPEIAVTGSNSPTVLTVRSQPSATLTGTQNTYEGFPASLTLTFGGESPWTVTYADSLNSYSITATINPYPLEVRPNRSTTYRLVSITNGCGSGPVSGTATVSVLPLLGIVDNPLDPLVKTYPVPTTTVLTVELDLPLTTNPATLSLTDISGRTVLQQTTRSKKQQLDLTAQPSGLYFLHIQVGDRQTVRKVLKQ